MTYEKWSIHWFETSVAMLVIVWVGIMLHISDSCGLDKRFCICLLNCVCVFFFFPSKYIWWGAYALLHGYFSFFRRDYHMVINHNSRVHSGLPASVYIHTLRLQFRWCLAKRVVETQITTSLLLGYPIYIQHLEAKSQITMGRETRWQKLVRLLRMTLRSTMAEVSPFTSV